MRDLESIAQLYLGLAGADSAEKSYDRTQTYYGHSRILVRCIRILLWQNGSSKYLP